MSAPVQFGTDGWRAVIADTFTFANVARVAQAAADYWSAHPPPGTRRKIVIGYDRRFLSDQFAARAAEVFAGNEFNVVLTPVPTPTPSVSLAVKQFRAAGGVVITASHNPPHFNGFKLKAHYGGPAMPELCQAVESFLDRHPVRRLTLVEAKRQRRVLFCDVRPAHYTALRRLVDFDLLRRTRLKFAHEALFGVGAGCFEPLLEGTRCRVTTLNGAHDPLFGGINPEPVRANYRLSAGWLRRHPHNLCLVTDGDADRVGAMTGRGGYVSTHEVIALLLRHYVKNRGERGRVIKALTTTSMLDKMCAAYGLPLEEVPVGFKHICGAMVQGGVMLGGEESGGIGFAGHIPERDGLAAGLLLLEMLAMERQPLERLIAALHREFGPHHYDRNDLVFPVEERAALMQRLAARPPDRLLRSPVVRVDTYDGVKFTAADSSWLMLRGSGTEPVLRVYAEAASPARAAALLRLGRRLAGQS
ncbi:MAG: phosphoglucomutase/phosphomannomutase family protein [Limisphaerales bacterium]|jgi:phosphomannomutase